MSFWNGLKDWIIEQVQEGKVFGDEHPPRAPAELGAEQIVNPGEPRKAPHGVPEYYDSNNPPDSRNNLVAAIGNKVKPIADIYLNKPIPEEFVDKSTQWAEGDNLGYNEITKDVLENPEKLKEKLSTQPLTIIDEMFPVYLTGRSDNEGDKHFFARSPKDTTYVNSVLTQKDKRNGYILEERWGVKYRVKQSTKELHPQDKPKFQRRVEDMQRAVEELNEAGAAFDEAMAGSAENIKITPEGDFTQEANNTEKLTGSFEGASKAEDRNVTQNNGTINKNADLLLRALLPGQARVKNLTFTFTNLGDGVYLADESGINTGIALRQAVKVGIASGILPDPAEMESDYKFIEGGLGIGKFVSGAAGLMIDKKGNVYAMVDASVGYGLGFPVTGSLGQGYFGNADKSDEEKYREALAGGSFGTTTGAGIQGNASIGTSGVISGEVSVTPGIGKTFGGRYVWYLFNIYE